MSGISILRRDGACEASADDASNDRLAIRKNAFESNLALQLEKSLGGDASLSDIEAITHALGAAYRSVTHAIDARTSISLGVRRYFVLQAGWAPKTGDYRLDALDPFAAKLLTRLPPETTEQIEPRVKAIGKALGKTEISRRHPTDMRLRLNTPWIRLYLNFLSGRDKRDQSTNVTHNRRKPVNEKIGLCILLAFSGALSLLGACLIAGTLWALFNLAITPGGRDTLSLLIDSSMVSLSSYPPFFASMFDAN